jgi:hypothetical protein
LSVGVPAVAQSPGIPKEADMALWCGYAMVVGAQTMREMNARPDIVEDWERQSLILIGIGRDLLVEAGLPIERVDAIDADLKAVATAEVQGDPAKARYDYGPCKVLADLYERNGVERYGQLPAPKS